MRSVPCKRIFPYPKIEPYELAFRARIKHHHSMCFVGSSQYAYVSSRVDGWSGGFTNGVDPSRDHPWICENKGDGEKGSGTKVRLCSCLLFVTVLIMGKGRAGTKARPCRLILIS
jgi:hypothetical protein